MASWAGWEKALLRALRAPITRDNLQFLREWQAHEGGTASFNPLNTTQHAPGAGSYNSVGVRNYRSVQQGLRATVATLKNGHYEDILGGLRSGSSTAAQLASAASLKTWGTGTWGSEPPSPSPSPPDAPDALGVEPTAPARAKQDALLGGLTALSRGRYDPTAGLAALRRASEATATAIKSTQETNIGSAALPITTQGPATQRARHAASMVQQYLGTPYVWGGESPKGFDCSGLLQWVWGHLGVKIPRVTFDQWKAGKSIGRNALRIGDAVFFRGSDSRNGLPGHVGMYIGGGMFVEAPHTGASVRISKLRGRSDYMGARRYG